MTIAAMTKTARTLAAGNYGYSQTARWSAFPGGKLAAKGDLDCSSSSGLIAHLGGLISRDVLKGTFWTGNFAQKLVGSGLFTALSAKGLSLAKLKATAREGDFLLGPGHVVYCLGEGRCVSFEADERGKASGGKQGDQTGREGRIRDIYSRSKGWTVIVRPISPATLQRRVLTAYSAGDTKALGRALDLLTVRAPWDGPRTRWMIEALQRWDKGLPLTYDPAQLTVPAKSHAFVVLGSALTATGAIDAKFQRRLQLAAAALRLNPASKVIVSGGAVKKGVTEAAAGQRWLVAGGIDPARIITEAASASTIGNAKGSVPLLVKHKLTAYTLVTDASHIRRASALFLAARIALELPTNKKLGLTTAGWLAHNDYAPAAAKSARPVETTTRTTIAAEVRTVLGL